MSWIGLTDHQEGRFAPSGLNGDRTKMPLPKLLHRGTVMLETRVPGQIRPHDLLGISHQFPWPRDLVFRAIPGGGIAMVHRHNEDVIHTARQWSGDGRAHSLRVTYAWDIPTGWARLALEQPEGGQTLTAMVDAPRPLIANDMRDLMLGSECRSLSKDVLFGALSTDIAPVGPMPTLHPATPIATPDGYRNAGDLQRGDTVLTDCDTIVPVLNVVRTRVPARGSFAPVRLRAPYFGLTRDIIVAPEQRLVLQGSEVEYNFGQEAVLVPARHVVNGAAATWAASCATVEYVQVVLPGHEVLIAAGCAVESLYIGRIRRDEVRLAASVLSDVPSRLLPEHAKPFHQVLRPFEAITLLDQRAA
ncbi:Hint domain-containing protein [uncultured Tateyamaria sp.]|uniref:Hint domain-containing protein n=1 Tax=uncultured Tateyamaria sp. TaxID=455651 RepID=UPI002611AC3F|nr:Hint domain-containing protein [uncultured Tateyamaria sp.]